MSAQWPDGPVTTDEAEEAIDSDAAQSSAAEPREDTAGDAEQPAAAEPREDPAGDAEQPAAAEPDTSPGESAQAQPEQPTAQTQPDTATDASDAGEPDGGADAAATDKGEARESEADGGADAAATDKGEERESEADGGADAAGTDDGDEREAEADEDDDAPMYTTERAPEPVTPAPLTPTPEPAPEPASPAPVAEPAAAPAAEEAGGNGAAAQEGEEESDEEADTRPKITPVEGSEWYILQTYSGFENRVKKTIEEKLRVAALEHLVEEVFVPGEDVTRVKNGRKRTMHVIYFPGYVLIKMKLTDDLWHLLMDIPRVAGFVGGNNRDPQPLGEEELSHIRSQMSEGYRQATLKEEFEIGQQVIVIDGPFANFSGKIDEVNAEKSKLRVLISILGRSTPVELDFDKVKAHPDAG